MSDAAKPKVLTVVVPVYYNEASLSELFDEIAKFEAQLGERDVELELIFVDDGSGDDSFKRLLEIKSARPTTKLIKLTRNFGSVAASKTGFRYATGDAFTILAADLQDPVEKVLEMTDRWLQGDKFVICIREGRDDPLTTQIFAWLYYRIVRYIVLGPYPSGGYDLMLMDKAFLPFMVGSAKNTNPNMYAYWLGFTPTVLTYHRQKRRHGKSRWTFSKKIKFFIDSVTGFSVVPIRLISAFGLLTSIVSFFYGTYIFVHALLGNIEEPGYPTLVVLVTFYSGMILLMLGIIGEYLWRVFDITTNKPESVIEETYL